MLEPASIEVIIVDSHDLRQSRRAETGYGETVGRLLAPKSWRQGRLHEPFARPDVDLTEAEKEWRHILQRHDETTHRTGADGVW